MTTVRHWTGREAKALRAALRLSIRDFAAQLGVGVRTITKWEARGTDVSLRPAMQAVLDTALARASDEAKARFTLLAQPERSASSVDELFDDRLSDALAHPRSVDLVAVARLRQRVENLD